MLRHTNRNYDASTKGTGIIWMNVYIKERITTTIKRKLRGETTIHRFHYQELQFFCIHRRVPTPILGFRDSEEIGDILNKIFPLVIIDTMDSFNIS